MFIQMILKKSLVLSEKTHPVKIFTAKNSELFVLTVNYVMYMQNGRLKEIGKICPFEFMAQS